MVRAENRYWNSVEHLDPFLLPYAGFIMVHSFEGRELTAEQEKIAAELLTSDRAPHIHEVTVKRDDDLPRLSLGMRLEAGGDLAAVRTICDAAFDAWEATGGEIDDLELVELHLVYEPELAENVAADPIAEVSEVDYRKDSLELSELDTDGEPIILDVRTEFEMMRQD